MCRFDSAVSFVSARLREILKSTDAETKATSSEIRLRAKRPVVVVKFGKSFMLSEKGTLITKAENAVICSKEDLEDSFKRLCGFSVHSHQSNIADGFITLSGGHRVGIAGTAVCKNDKCLDGLRDISSLNIRIAREAFGCSNTIFKRVFSCAVKGLLIAGPPASGKTTILRDIVKKIADFENGESKKVCVIDERGELAAMKDGAAQNNVGINSDVLTGYPKAVAVQTALKTMSPEIIVCDEISSDDEIEAITQGANSGVVFIATVHAANFDDLIKRRQIEKLLDIGCFENVVLLDGAKNAGKILEVFETGEIKDEIYRRRFGLACGGVARNDACRTFFKA